MSKGEGTGPSFVAMFGPVLKAVRELGGSARPREVYDHVARMLHLGADVLAEETPSGAPRHENQMAWARFYLVRAGLLDASRRGVWTLTDRGREAGDLRSDEAVALYRRIREQMRRPSERSRTTRRDRTTRGTAARSRMAAIACWACSRR